MYSGTPASLVPCSGHGMVCPRRFRRPAAGPGPPFAIAGPSGSCGRSASWPCRLTRDAPGHGRGGPMAPPWCPLPRAQRGDGPGGR
eukprot:13181627-Alexandrium_andersonii.AAC.1